MLSLKKVFAVFFLSLFIFSCSKSEDTPNSSEIQINPPNWIQGKWLMDDLGQGENGWRFTSNDFIIIQANSELSQRELLQSLLDNAGDVSASDNSTDDTYSVTLNSIGGQSVIYSFTQVSIDEITWDTVANSIYRKQ